jgi:hypothetical protein
VENGVGRDFHHLIAGLLQDGVLESQRSAGGGRGSGDQGGLDHHRAVGPGDRLGGLAWRVTAVLCVGGVWTGGFFTATTGLGAGAAGLAGSEAAE